MPRDIPENYKTEKNLEVNLPILLYELNYEDDSWLFFCEYDTDVVFDGQTYTSFPMSHELISENIQGSIDTVRVKIANVSRAIQAYIETYDAFRGKAIRIKTVWSNHLDDPTMYTLDEFYVDRVVSDENVTEFYLSSVFDVLNVFLPLRKYGRHFCFWAFKSTECGYVGIEAACSHTLQRCRQLENQARYGAFPSIPDSIYYGF